MRGRENKKATVEDVAGQKKYLMDNHNQIGGVSSGCHELSGVARGMLEAASVGRQAFDLEGAVPVRIARLKRKASTDTEAGTDVDANAGKRRQKDAKSVKASLSTGSSAAQVVPRARTSDTCSVSGKSAGGSAKKKGKEQKDDELPGTSEPYFDFCKAAASAYESWALTMEELRCGFSSCKTDIDEVVTLYTSDETEEDIRKFVKYRVDLLQSKKKAVLLAMNAQSLPEDAAQKELDDFIKE